MNSAYLSFFQKNEKNNVSASEKLLAVTNEAVFRCFEIASLDATERNLAMTKVQFLQNQIIINL